MKYIKAILIVIILCVSTLLGLYYLYAKGYQRFYAFEAERMKEIISGTTNYDILFLGSSRTFYHVHPRIIDSITGMSSYNAGSDAANLLEMNLYLQCYVKSHPPPKVVVADISRSAFKISDRPFWNPNDFYPFLDNEIVYNTMSRFENVFLYKYLPFMRFTAANDVLKQNAFLGYLGRKNVDIKKTYKGYLEKSADTLMLPYKRMYPKANDAIEREGIEQLLQMTETCKSLGIQLILTYAPVYKMMDEKNPEFYPTIETIAAADNIPFWNYRHVNKLSDDHTLFRDEHHLNKQGVVIYSSLLSKNLIAFLDKK